MPTRTLTPTPTLHDSIPVGTDFIGGAAALPVRPAEPSQIVLGSDFAGGTVPLTAKVEHGGPASSSRVLPPVPGNHLKN
jgi:hypothetical protein